MNDKVDVRAERLEGVIADTAAIQAVDLLTSDEIELLKELVASPPSSLAQLVKDMNSDAVRQGMLFQLSDLGFLEGFKVHGGDVLGCYPTPKAAWAIARYDKRMEKEALQKAEAERIRKEDRKHQLIDIVIGWVLGILSGAVLILIEEAVKLHTG